MINSIICADCMDVMRNMPDDFVNLILTDIPYGEVNRKSNGLRSLDKGIADVITFNLEEFVKECVRVCSGSIYIFCGTEQVSEIRKLLVEAKLTSRLCCWHKTNPSPMNGQYVWLSGIESCVYGKKTGATFNEHCKTPVWPFPNGRSKIHPTEKPLKLFEYLVGVSSNENDLVLDPCLGSGTTALACKKLNRRYIGIEMSQEFCNLAQERLNNV